MNNLPTCCKCGSDCEIIYTHKKTVYIRCSKCNRRTEESSSYPLAALHWKIMNVSEDDVSSLC